MTPWWLVNARLVTPDGVRDGGALEVTQGRLGALREGGAPAGARVVDAQGGWITPGLMDSHVHGALVHDVMDATPEALAAISIHLARHGVTSWCPTTVACDPQELDRILSCLQRYREAGGPGATARRAHLESNFLAERFKGAQPAEWLRAPSDPGLRDLLARHQATIGLVTLAPELPGALELIGWLCARGIGVSVGHSDASYDQVMAAVAAGATRVTHLCNAQRGFHHREPGTLGAGLACEALTCEVIADGHHVHPAGLKIAYRCKGADRLVLVSDALRGSGLGPGSYELGGQRTHLDGQVARLDDGTIAGSVITLEVALKRMITEVGVPICEAVRMASTTVATSLGLTDTGRLASGLAADLALFDPDWKPRATWVAGRLVHGDPVFDSGARA